MVRRFSAIVFDLFGTLIPSMSATAFEHVLHNMADTLSADPTEFTKKWIYETWEKRRTGAFKTVEENILYICQSLGLKPDHQSLSRAADLRYDYSRSLLLNPRAHALETLNTLRLNGYKTGLLTNCSADIPHLWANTKLSSLIDAPVFSCSVGHVKPQPKSYHISAELLGVSPKSCAYVGDGSDRELTGARRAGMYPILITGAGRDPYDEQLDRREWDGPIIKELDSLMPLLH